MPLGSRCALWRYGSAWIVNREQSRPPAFILAEPAALLDGPALIARRTAATTRGSRTGRRFNDQITLFKSGGLAFLDLAAAKLALDNTVN